MGNDKIKWIGGTVILWFGFIGLAELGQPQLASALAVVTLISFFTLKGTDILANVNKMV